MKRIVIPLLVLAVAAAAGLNLFARKAPDILRAAIAKAINKDVQIGAIEYTFPWRFEVSGFEIRERAPFAGETSFSVDTLRLDISPLSLSKRMLIIDRAEVENADITIRKIEKRILHPLSAAVRRSPKTEALESAQGAGGGPSLGQMPLEIRRFVIRKSHFRFIDYDVSSEGFVIALTSLDGAVRGISVPDLSQRTTYDVRADMPQGRDETPATVKISGWADFSTFDTETQIRCDGAALAYYRPYYAQVTPAQIRGGVLDARANIRIEQKELILNLDLAISDLDFENYESGDQLFGLKAEEMLALLKDRSGKLHFPIVARWNLSDRSVRARDVIRKSIERSLKNIVLGNIGNVVENTLRRIGEKGLETSKDELDGVAKKIKDIFR